MFPIFKGKAYGSVTVGERGQLVVPAALRKSMDIKQGDQLMVFAHPEKKVISLISSKDLAGLLEKAEKILSKLENKVSYSKV